jgi:hypothetical protein
MDPRAKRHVRQIAARAYFTALFALAAIVAWAAVAGPRKPGGNGAKAPAASVATSGDLEELFAGGESPAPGGAQPLSCDTKTHLQMLGPLREASGLTLSRRTPGVLWSMDDSDDPVVVPLSTSGAPMGHVRITGASVTDWEAIATGPCANGSCLYVGDIGDIHGEGKRLELMIYRVAEPAPGDPSTAKADTLVVDYPDRGHDAEAMFVTPDATIYIVTKGHPTELFRVPRNAKPGTASTLEHVSTLPIEKFLEDQDKKRTRVTDAEISPDGAWVALRTNAELLLYRTADLIAGHSAPVWHADLRPIDETQGEGIAITNDGDVYLAGEGGGHGLPGTFAHITCELPRDVSAPASGRDRS